METQKNEMGIMKFVAPFLLFVLTIVLAQQLVDVFFRESLVGNDSIRVIAKLVIDCALIAIGLGLKHKKVADPILYAGLIRFVLVFFQLQGMDPVLRVVALLLAVIAIFTVGYLKFGKELSSGSHDNNNIK